MKFFKLIIFVLLLTSVLQAGAKPLDYLKKCWEKQVEPLQGQSLTFSFHENLNELEHNFEPLQASNFSAKGQIWISPDNFLKKDTLLNIENNQVSSTRRQLTKEFLSSDLILKTLRYSPISLINYFIINGIPQEQEKNKDFAIYKTIIDQTITKLYIRKKDHIIYKITTLHDDELFGDVLTTFIYNDHLTINNLYYPASILILKINGKIQDEVKLTNIKIDKAAPFLKKTVGYKKEVAEAFNPGIKIEKYSDHIYFIELKHANERVMVVVFSDFLLVNGAPFNSKNGELIISEAKKIAPGKPIKYFTFGHHHPHYLGGIRAFVHKGTTVLSIKSNVAYVKYLSDAPHTLNPDSLNLQPKALQIEEIENRKVISDGEFEMKIFFIGNQSEHTNDYLIYYFPKEKLLYQDDLVWISKEGEIEKARPRQAGLYKAVKELGLDIHTIIQSWPLTDYNVKTVIPFEDLEKSMTK